jgi:hypothetical protein
MRSRLRNILVGLVVVLPAGTLLCGCTADRIDRLMASQNENIALREENTRLTKELEQAKVTIQNQSEQIANLNRLGPARFDELTKVGSVEFGRMTGGYNTDSRDGTDDGIDVYITPKDNKGHIIKVAGELQVQLFELTIPPRLIGECSFTAKELDSKWASRFLANHYYVRCPFKVTPTDKNITVQVKFIELLTGKSFVIQKMVSVELPSPQTTTCPAD